MPAEAPLPVLVTKRSVGVALILLATPFAMLIAIVLSCVSAGYQSATGPKFVVLFGGPFLTLAALMAWAAALHRPEPGEPFNMPWRIGVLLLTPVVVAAATGIGIAIAAGVVEVASRIQGDLSETGLAIGMLLFWVIPIAALFTMLRLAWKANEVRR